MYALPTLKTQNPGLPILSAQQQENLARAKQYAVQESVKHILLKQQAKTKQVTESLASAPGSQSMMMQKQQAVVLMCRVYIGSIYYDLKEEVIRNAFAPFGPFKSINMSFDPITGKHKGFAFIEYECPEAAQLALEQMGGVLLGGRSIKVGRPANMPQSHPVIDLLLEESKSQTRIYVGSVHEDLTSEDLKSVFSAFGTILSCSLANDALTGKHKGYGFIEFETLDATNEAVGSMNLFDLGGQFLRVRKAIAPEGMQIPAGSSFGMVPMMASAPTATTTKFQSPNKVLLPTPVGIIPSTKFANLPPSVAYIPPQSLLPPPGVVIPTIAPPGMVMPTSLATPVAIVAPTPNEQDDNTQLPNTLSAQEDVKLSGVEARHMIMHKLMRKETTKVMLLKNMVGVEEIDDDLEEEVEEECDKYGKVDRVIIFSEKQSEAEDAEVIVKIFVMFADEESCQKAIAALNGRWFGGKKVSATMFSQEKFDRQDYCDS